MKKVIEELKTAKIWERIGEPALTPGVVPPPWFNRTSTPRTEIFLSAGRFPTATAIDNIPLNEKRQHGEPQSHTNFGRNYYPEAGDHSHLSQNPPESLANWPPLELRAPIRHINQNQDAPQQHLRPRSREAAALTKSSHAYCFHSPPRRRAGTNKHNFHFNECSPSTNGQGRNDGRRSTTRPAEQSPAQTHYECTTK